MCSSAFKPNFSDHRVNAKFEADFFSSESYTVRIARIAAGALHKHMKL
jgi:hypothetical protein